MPRPKKEPQFAFTDVTLNDPELEDLLRRRERAAEARKPYNDNYNGIKKQLEAKLAQRELATGTSVRVGEFIIEVTESESREVSFERASKISYKIKPAT